LRIEDLRDLPVRRGGWEEVFDRVEWQTGIRQFGRAAPRDTNWNGAGRQRRQRLILPRQRDQASPHVGDLGIAGAVPIATGSCYRKYDDLPVLDALRGAESEYLDVAEVRGQYLGASRQLRRRHDVDENTGGNQPSGEVSQEQKLVALVTRLPEFRIERRLY
jgi:hypothetical protein